MEDEKIKETILDTVILSLEAQARAVRRLKGAPIKEKPLNKRMSQLDIVYDILKRSGRELHINEILERVHKSHGVTLDRESVVSALTKRIRRNDRFVRTGKNVFALKGSK